MKNKIGLIIAVIAIVGLFAGVYLLYGILSEKYVPEKISVNNTSENSESKEINII